jgi:hypothetical protein
VATVGWVVGASILLTAIHFTDNYVSIDTYPQPDWVTGAAVLISWPLFSALGIIGFFLYRQGRVSTAHPFLVAYAFAGLSSLAHFLSGGPGDFTTRGLISIFIDGIAGAAVLTVAIWSMVALRHEIPEAAKA